MPERKKYVPNKAAAAPKTEVEFPVNKRLEVSLRSVADLVPAARNARTHSEAQIEVICASLKEFGWTNPVLIGGKNGIVAGHGRVLAARKLGMTEVPVIELAHLTAAQRRAYLIADNQTALRAGWDLAALKLELTELQAVGFDLAPLGFDPIELGALLGTVANVGLTDPDAVPDAPEIPVAATGDLWALGRHWLLCGDATKAEDTKKVVQGVTPHLMVTDPPYGVNYDASWRNVAMPDTNPGKSGGSRGKIKNDDRADWREAWALFMGDVAYVWHGGNKAHIVAESLLACGLEIRAQIIWAKHQFVISRGHYHPHHEPCWYAVRKTATGHWSGDRKQSTLWQIQKPLNSETGHSTQKPVECMKRPIENNSSPGQAVYDPFVGSGTTIIAAEMTGRSCHAIELNPAYVDVCIKRWQDFTGQVATLEGIPFAEIETRRQKRAA